MIDFTDRKVYEREKRRMQNFLDDKLVTASEANTVVEFGDVGTDGDESIIDTSSVMGGDPIDFGEGGGFSDWGDDTTIVTGKKRELDLANDRSYERDTWWENFLFAPWYLLVYVSKQLAYDFPDKEDWRNILKSLNKITIFSAITGGLMWWNDLVFLISAPFQTVTSLMMFVTSFMILRYVYGEGKGNSEIDDSGIDFTGTAFEEISDDEGGFSGESLTLGADDSDEFALDWDDGSETDELTEVNSSGYSEGMLEQSPIDVTNDKMFDRGLLKVFADNSKYEGVEIAKRKELLESFAGYIVTNDKNYGKWRLIGERTVEYNNIMYSLFKGLGQMVNQFLTDDEKFVVMDVRSNPLLFKIEVELPSYFKERAVRGNLYEIENVLKRNEDDTDVSVTCSYYRGVFVFKFLRLDNQNLISFGDILRFYDETKGETALEIFADDRKGLPVLLGLRENEYPYVLDMEENTSGTIVGGSGSGKSWLTFLLMFNLVLANDYNNVQFIVLDKKDASFWNQFAKFPHVLGYHTNILTYVEILREVYAEAERRKQLLKELGAEDVKGLRERLRKNQDYEGLKEMPLLTVVIDEITSTMQDLKIHYQDDEALYNEVRSIISMITQEGRSLGVRVILIGQRAVDLSIPKNAMMNSTFKLGMRMENDSDFNIMFGRDADRLTKPKGKGLGLSRTMEEPGIYMIKTLTVGGTSNDQILKLIRVLAMDWVRRSKGQDNLINPPDGMSFELSYNRDKFLTESLQELEEGRILTEREVNQGFSERDLFGGGSRTQKWEEDEDEEDEEPVNEIEEPEEVKPIPEVVRVPESVTYEPPTIQEVEVSKRTETESIKKIETVKPEVKRIESVKPNEIPEDTNYADDDDDDIFDLWEGVEVAITTTEIKEIEEVEESKIIENVEEDVGEFETFSSGKSIEEMMEEDRQRRERQTGSEHGGELSIIERDLAVKPEEIPESETNWYDSSAVPEEGIEEMMELPPLVEESEIDNFPIVIEAKEVKAKEEKPSLGIEEKVVHVPKQEIQKGETVRKPQQQESKKEINPSGYKEKGKITMGFTSTGVTKESGKNTMSIKQYIIEYGEKDSILNRKMLCEDLESEYPMYKIEQAVDMLAIIKDGEWYITKL